MKDVLEFLDLITPLWAVFITSFLVVGVYSWLIWTRSKRFVVDVFASISDSFSGNATRGDVYASILGLIHVASEHLSILVIHGVMAFLYFSFAIYESPIEIRGPLVRFALISMFVLQFSRGLYKIVHIK